MSPPDLMPTASTVLAGLDLSGLTVVITGATAGMGLASAEALAAAGARVGLLGRSSSGLVAAYDRVHQVAAGFDPFVVQLDLASLASVRRGVGQVLDEAPRIDVLMNNAGVMFTPFGRTEDGFETQFGTCHLGHFALTEGLSDALAAAADRRGCARVVTLSSAGHAMGDIDLADPNWERRDYDKFVAYGAAKTANLLHTVELARRLSPRGVDAFAVHPGTVATELARHMTREDFSTMFNYGADAKREDRPRTRVATPAEGAATQVWAAVTEDLTGRGGLYLADCAVSDRVEPYATDPARAAELWHLSQRLTGY